MIKALQVYPELSFDPRRFCVASTDHRSRKGKYEVVVTLKDVGDHTLEFNSLKDALDAVAHITSKVNEAMSPTQPEEKLTSREVNYAEPVPEETTQASANGTNESPTQMIGRGERTQHEEPEWHDPYGVWKQAEIEESGDAGKP